MTKLDAAIHVLARALETARIKDPCPICEIEAAIRILEAAAKVDGDIAIKIWDWLHSESAICPPWVNAENSRAIRALLAALPDGGDAGIELMRKCAERYPGIIQETALPEEEK